MEDKQTETTSGARVLEILEGLARRGRLVALTCGLGWIASASFVLLIGLVSVLGWWGGSAVRAFGWAVVGSTFATLVVTVLVKPLRALKREHVIARRIGRRFPELASDVLTASQLLAAPRGSRFSRSLIDRHFDSVSESLDSLQPERVYPFGALVPPAALLAAGLFTASAIYILAPRLLETGLAALFRDPRPPERTQARLAGKSPVVGDLTLTLRYPEYLQRAERRLDASSGGFAAPLGTTVLVEGRSLVPGASQGEILLPQGGSSAISVGADGKVRGRFVVSGAGPFVFSLHGRFAAILGPEHYIEVEADSPPSIRLLRPNGPLDLAENDAVVLDLEAEDDHGLDHIDLVLRSGAELELRKPVTRLTHSVRRLRTSYRFSLESLKLGDATNLELELEAFDNDTILGPKPGRSEPLVLHVMTPLGRHNTALFEQNQVLDALVDLLGARLSTSVPAGRKNDSAEQRFLALRNQTEDVLSRIAKLVGALSHDPLTPRRVVDTFVQIRDDLSNQLVYESGLHRGDPSPFAKRVGVDRVTIRLLEAAVIRVDDLVIEQQISRVVRGGGHLDQYRAELERSLDQFRDTRSETARRGLLSSIEQMEQAISRLLHDVEEVRGKVDETYLNPAGLLRLDLLGVLARLKALVAEGDLDAAAALSERLETDIGRLMAGLEGSLLSFRTDRFSEGERFTGELLDKVVALEASQLQLRRETTALQRRLQERLAAAMRGKIDGLVKRELGRAARMQQVIEHIPSPSDADMRTRLERVRIAHKELSLALDQGDLEEAGELAENLADLAGEMSQRSSAGASPALGSIAESSASLSEEIANAFPKPGQLLSDRDRTQIRAEAESQRLLLADTRQLNGWIEKQGDETRFLSYRARHALGQVKDKMADAVSHLEGKRIRNALAEQSAVLEELARLREDLKRGDEVLELESRPVILHGRVELPAPDEYEVPAEFRRDILEAMKGDLPKPYAEAIRRYYETLVR